MLLTSLSFSLALLFGPALVWADGFNVAGFFTEFHSELHKSGFSGLAIALQSINGSTIGDQLFLRLTTSGKNYTVFVPTNEALSQVNASVSGNASLLAEYISYHIVEGDFANTTSTNSSGGGGSSTSSTASLTSTGSTSSSTSTSTSQTAALFGRLLVPRAGGGSSNVSNSSNLQILSGIYPNVTIGRTLLNSSDLVHLAGNKSQVLAWTRFTPQGNVTILNQGTSGQNVTVANSTIWRNIFINGINGTLVPPGNLTTALNATNATAFAAFASTVQLTTSNGTNATATEALQNATGITFFIPNTEAFNATINSTLQGLQSNATALQAVLQNHYINGTTLYTTLITNSTTAVSAAGEPFTFFKNETGTFVGANNTIAQIVQPDVLLENGVAHIINAVLFATASDPTAASSAYQSATSAAAQSTTETGPIAASTTQSPSSSSSTSSSLSGTATQTTSA